MEVASAFNYRFGYSFDKLGREIWVHGQAEDMVCGIFRHGEGSFPVSKGRICGLEVEGEGVIDHRWYPRFQQGLLQGVPVFTDQ